MKKLFFALLFASIAPYANAQPTPPDLSGLWKIISAPVKIESPPEYLLLMDDSIYAWGVDSAENPLPHVVTGRWTITSNTELELSPSDRYADKQYFDVTKDKRYRFVATKKGNVRKPVPSQNAEIYLEKYARNYDK
ncbi:MAG: hypothetical protein Q8916_09040 [Bacteroidota bacterium]|nr:hypothetical protein [Bacteroidota bacterium]MDP4230531.1 hypothetical protein [Bacteroidota bacterium]MDP4236122.1 hypothetical protein [Bacteroidota bacterium]